MSWGVGSFDVMTVCTDLLDVLSPLFLLDENISFLVIRQVHTMRVYLALNVLLQMVGIL